jgi:integrase/recombinase XerC
MSEPQHSLPPTGAVGAVETTELLATLRTLIGDLSANGMRRSQLFPFQFPSLRHFETRVEAAVVRAREVDGLSTKSIRAYRAAFRQFRAYLHDTQSAHRFIDGQAQSQIRILEQWIAWMRSRGLNHTSVNTYWRSLHAALARIAREDGLVIPTALVAAPRPGSPTIRYLTKEALGDVFRFIRNYQWRGGAFECARNLALVATMALAGCRLGEVMRLQIEDVDVESEQPTIRVKKGKGQRGGKGRIVCVPPPLLAVLRDYLELRRRRGLASDRLFVSAGRDQPIAEITIRRLCQLASEKTGVKVAPHLLRHTCATLMRQEGVADRLSMEQLGHSSLGVLQKYSHVAPGERSAVIARFNVEWDSGPESIN